VLNVDVNADIRCR